MGEVKTWPSISPIEVCSERRRRWSVKDKGRIVAESFEQGVKASDVARRHGIAPQQLFYWRKQACAKTTVVPAAGDVAFAEARIEPAPQDRAAPIPEGTGLELMVGATSLRVTSATDLDLLAHVVRGAA